MVCSFFGHKDTPISVYPYLLATTEKLIQYKGIDSFIVGNQGGFDNMVLCSLRELKQKYPHIRYNVILAYMPGKGEKTYNPFESCLPEGIESVPKRFAISWRNKWMVQRSDIVICYIAHSWGGAAQFVEYAKKQCKEIINLAVQE